MLRASFALFALPLLFLGGCGTSTTPGRACRHASDCTGSVCIAGTCAASTSCTSSRGCPGLVCDLAAGICAECVTDGDCSGGAHCRADVCVATVACTSDRDCSATAEVCDTTGHVCEECNVDADCSASDRCADHVCVPRAPMDATPASDAGIDATTQDGGVDAWIDGGLDGGADAGNDGGSDGGRDGGHDGGTDADMDAGPPPPCLIEGWYFTDVDGDGAGDPHDVVRACSAPAGRVAVPGDCDDHDPARRPGATEACDGTIDDDCDGSIDEGCACPAGTSRPCGLGIGACATGTQQCEYPAVLWGHCYSYTPTPESCNGIDDDCDGITDEGGDAACGAGATCDALGICSSVHPVTVVTRDRTSYAIMSDGSLYVWGNGSTVASAVPTSMGASEVRAIAAVDNLVCFATATQHVYCWTDCGLAPPGQATGGACGNPIYFNDYGAFPAVDLTLGSQTGCLVAADGTVRCWGSGSSGLLGLGSSGFEMNPIPITGLGPVVDLAQDLISTCAVETSGAVQCWGRNDSGDLGGGTLGGMSAALVHVPITDAVAIAGGYEHYCAQRASGDVMCWGTDDFGELGDGAPATRSATPVRVVGIPSGSRVPTSLASASTCVITPGDGSVMCFGYGDHGSLGNGLATSSVDPVTVSGLTGVLQLSGAGEHWCALTATAVWCWGTGLSGEVGTGHLVPGRITGLP